jgi:hypothetical protein
MRARHELLAGNELVPGGELNLYGLTASGF